MNAVFQKLVTGVLIAVLGLASLPLANVYAAAPVDAPTPTPTPGAASPERTNARLERAFARQSRAVERLGKLYTNFGQGFPKIQKLLDKAKERGLDVSSIETALQAFKNALPNGRAAYDQAKSIVDSHNGFDASGKVTDAETARSTLKSLHAALEQFHTAMGGTGKALHEAVQAFHKAHPHPGRP